MTEQLKELENQAHHLGLSTEEIVRVEVEGADSWRPPNGGNGGDGDKRRRSRRATTTRSDIRSGRARRTARWVGRTAKGVKTARAVGTLGVGLVTGEIATGLCTPRDLSETERAGYAAALGLVPPLFDILAACNATLMYEIYRPITAVYGEETLQKYREWGVSESDLAKANRAWHQFTSGQWPR